MAETVTNRVDSFPEPASAQEHGHQWIGSMTGTGIGTGVRATIGRIGSGKEFFCL
ncbi:MAG TPA: hypothetical protein VIG80_08730 [Bacillaceae bacterium]